MTHTPGPWKVGHWGGHCLNPEHVAARRHPGPPECVYEPYFSEGYGGIAGNKPNQMVVDTHYDELVIGDADAHLIAAAPELLEALKKLRTEDYRWEDIQKADAAIAKAEGR